LLTYLWYFFDLLCRVRMSHLSLHAPIFSFFWGTSSMAVDILSLFHLESLLSQILGCWELVSNSGPTPGSQGKWEERAKDEGGIASLWMRLNTPKHDETCLVVWVEPWVSNAYTHKPHAWWSWKPGAVGWVGTSGRALVHWQRSASESFMMNSINPINPQAPNLTQLNVMSNTYMTLIVDGSDPTKAWGSLGTHWAGCWDGWAWDCSR
jgi:hypothetical protein